MLELVIYLIVVAIVFGGVIYGEIARARSEKEWQRLMTLLAEEQARKHAEQVVSWRTPVEKPRLDHVSYVKQRNREGWR